MNREQFIKILVSNGFPEPTLVEREAGGFLGDHTHPFEVKAWVVSGQIDMVVDGVRSAYIAGDVFHLLANQVHTEWYGNKGVQYLASRKNMPEGHL
jgi:quercetin dioxygenase-like cupin family protein